MSKDRFRFVLAMLGAITGFIVRYIGTNIYDAYVMNSKPTEIVDYINTCRQADGQMNAEYVGHGGAKLLCVKRMSCRFYPIAGCTGDVKKIRPLIVE